MEVVYYRERLNFGDNLNEVIWPHVFKEATWRTGNTTLIGIGSILCEERVGQYADSRNKVIVLGTGTSYGTPPRDMSKWSVLAVRGPLTAAVIGMPQVAATDGAILLAGIPALTGTPRLRSEILFIPHHSSVLTTPWKQIAEDSGMEYVDPQQSAEAILKRFAGAKLVVTEAMHGAIFADTLRIPWIPIAISPAIEEFKWRDWCASMNLSFLPKVIPAGTSDDRYRFDSMAMKLDKVGIAGFSNVEGVSSKSELESFLQRRFAPALTDSLWRPPGTRLQRLLRRPLRLYNHGRRREVVTALKAAMAGPTFLSADSVFDSRFRQMQDAVQTAESLITSLR